MRLLHPRALVFILLISSGPLCASSSPDEVFTVARAVQTAFERNPDILNGRDRIIEGQSTESFTRSQAFPNISAKLTANEKKAAVNSGSPAFGGDPYNQYIGQIDLSQPIYAAGAISSAIGAAKKETQIREFDLEITKRDLTLSVLQAFYSILLNEKLLDIYRDAEQVQKESLATSRRYHESGRGQLIDVYQNETQLALITPKIVQTENQVKASGYLLATLLHATDLSNIRAKGELTILNRTQIDKILEQKKAERYELSRQLLKYDQFEFNRTLQLASNLPTLSLIGNINRTATDKNELTSSNSTAWTVGLQLNIPLFSGLSSINQRHILNAQESQLKDQEIKLRDQLSLQEIQAMTSLNNAETVLTASQKAADFSKKALNEAKKNYRVQMIGPFQFLLIEQSYLDAQSSNLNAKFNYLVALENCFVALGAPLSVLVDMLENNHAAETLEK